VPDVAFGFFDHVDRGNEPVATLHANRLALVEAADRAGFRTYHVASTNREEAQRWRTSRS
jgi:hypothetical protein